MTKFLTTPTRRIVFAIALSALLHALALWLPEIQLPRHEKKLPPLIARLEPLPKTSAKLSPPKPQARPQPQPAVPSLPEPPVAESAPVAASVPQPASAPIADEPAPPPVLTEAAPAQAQRPPLPKHARLHFNVYYGQEGIKIGEADHALEIIDGRYTLTSDVKTTGFARLLKSYHMTQTSSGTTTYNILKPDTFTEEITDSNGKQTTRADFDWANDTIRFSRGGAARLHQQAQDILSILYQFPAMKQPVEIVSIHIGTGKKYEEYRFEIAFAEPLETPMGTLQTVHFRKLHADREEGLEIWFAQEYRLLPVKMRHIDGSGNIAGEALITDIGVSDE